MLSFIHSGNAKGLGIAPANRGYRFRIVRKQCGICETLAESHR
jgi:hypothetical protein